MLAMNFSKIENVSNLSSNNRETNKHLTFGKAENVIDGKDQNHSEKIRERFNYFGVDIDNEQGNKVKNTQEEIKTKNLRAEIQEKQEQDKLENNQINEEKIQASKDLSNPMSSLLKNSMSKQSEDQFLNHDKRISPKEPPNKLLKTIVPKINLFSAIMNNKFK